MFGDVWSRLFLCIHWLNDKMNGTMKNLLWIAAILLASCTGKKSDEGILTGQPVDLDPSARLVASALFDTIEYVPLETNDTFLVGYIERPKLAGDDICFISMNHITVIRLFNTQIFFHYHTVFPFHQTDSTFFVAITAVPVPAQSAITLSPILTGA